MRKRAGRCPLACVVLRHEPFEKQQPRLARKVLIPHACLPLHLFETPNPHHFKRWEVTWSKFARTRYISASLKCSSTCRAVTVSNLPIVLKSSASKSACR